MNTSWWRYTSTASNANRKRANAISRIFLCNDYLSRPIEFDRDLDLTDEDAVTDALQNDPACVNCHVSLDPLAGYLWGFWWFIDDNPADMSSYHPERELLRDDYSGVATAPPHLECSDGITFMQTNPDSLGDCDVDPNNTNGDLQTILY